MIDWQALPDGALVDRDLVASVVQGCRRGTSTFSQYVRYFDFESCGKPFTQVALVLEPAVPLIIGERRVVIVTSEEGSDNGRCFVRDRSGREGIGPFLACRGVTFISLCRLGRWNFLTDDPLGSWEDVPLGERMPIFHRGQGRHWPGGSYATTDADGIASLTGSTNCRSPRPGSALDEHMLALTPETSAIGFELALAGCVDLTRRQDVLLLYWGFSTGGTFMWTLAKRVPPDGVVGYGTSSLPLATFYGSAGAGGDFSWLYDKAAARVRERGPADFDFFNRDLAAADRQRHWLEALKEPRFKSHEDPFMCFAVAALCESLTRLWNAAILPAHERARGLAGLIQNNLSFAFPDDTLNSIKVLDLYGTEDEVIPPTVARRCASLMRPYCRSYQIAFIDGFHHSVAADHAEAFGALWLDAITSDYFAR